MGKKNFPFNSGPDEDSGRAKIFESPDGGKTVYVREAGSLDREIYSSIANDYFSSIDVEKWRKIIKAGKGDPGLQELLDRVIVYYELSKQDGT